MSCMEFHWTVLNMHVLQDLCYDVSSDYVERCESFVDYQNLRYRHTKAVHQVNFPKDLFPLDPLLYALRHLPGFLQGSILLIR